MFTSREEKREILLLARASRNNLNSSLLEISNALQANLSLKTVKFQF